MKKLTDMFDELKQKPCAQKCKELVSSIALQQDTNTLKAFESYVKKNYTTFKENCKKVKKELEEVASQKNNLRNKIKYHYLINESAHFSSTAELYENILLETSCALVWLENKAIFEKYE